MHSVADLILEAVENSSEAGAETIKALAEEKDGVWRVEILDDGKWTLEEDPFSVGATTKGRGHGRGLCIIKERTGGRCSLTRGEGYTRLCFEADDDGSMDDSFHALLPVLLRKENVWIRIGSSGLDVSFTSDDLRREGAFPSDARGIRAFRAYLEGLGL